MYVVWDVGGVEVVIFCHRSQKDDVAKITSDNPLIIATIERSKYNINDYKRSRNRLGVQFLSSIRTTVG